MCCSIYLYDVDQYCFPMFCRMKFRAHLVLKFLTYATLNFSLRPCKILRPLLAQTVAMKRTPPMPQIFPYLEMLTLSSMATKITMALIITKPATPPTKQPAPAPAPLPTQSP